MTIDEARDCASILANAYGMGSRRVGWYADMLERLPAGPTAEFLEGWVEREKTPPTIAAIKAGVRQRQESAGMAAATYADRGQRIEQLVTWRAILEDPGIGRKDYDDAYDRVRWMQPPCQQDEWRLARTIADERHHERNQKLAADGKKPRDPRPPLSWPEPPRPAEPQTILSRQAHRAGFAALFLGLQQRLDPAQMTEVVMTAVRQAEDEARARREWESA